MVSRRTRSYKEKSHFTSFGQFMLPLAVLMALALLFFSVRLFFFGSSDTKRTLNHTTPHAPIEAPQTPDLPANAGPATTAPAALPQTASAKRSTPATTAAPVAGPVTATTPSDTAPSTQPAAAATPQTKIPTAAPATQTTTSTATQANSGSRFDVQIGSFASKQNAESLAQKVRGQGYDIYLSETTSNGKPFYRVRVKGTATRESAQTLAQKLEGLGYPTMLVPPGK